ncbi:hypothetical protein AB0K48_50685 [Nonomuraea sp. NPDC055795]
MEDQRFVLLQALTLALAALLAIASFLHPLRHGYKRALRFQPNRVAMMAQHPQIRQSLIMGRSKYNIIDIRS